MNLRPIGFIILLPLSSNPMLSGQEFPENTLKADNCLPGKSYPRIYDDGRVIFQLNAPDASEVIADIVGKKFPMVKDERSVWTLTTEPIGEGFHYYAFIVDGARVSDPATHTYFGANAALSGIDIPSPDMDFYLPRDVPHGEVRAKYYFSDIRNATRRCFVYTPPDYDQNTNE